MLQFFFFFFFALVPSSDNKERGGSPSRVCTRSEVPFEASACKTMSLSSPPSTASGHSEAPPSQLTESLLGSDEGDRRAANEEEDEEAEAQASSKCCRCGRSCMSNVAHLLQLTLWFGLTIFGIAQHKVAGPLIAADQVGNATWATLPVALTDIGGIIFAIPVSLIVKRIGWRKGFMVGGAMGVFSSMVCFVATWFDNYYVLLCGSLFMSVWNVCGYYVRFAAAESVDPSWDTSRVISYVLVSSAVTGSFGPQMVALMNNFVTDYFSVYIEASVHLALLCGLEREADNMLKPWSLHLLQCLSTSIVLFPFSGWRRRSTLHSNCNLYEKRHPSEFGWTTTSTNTNPGGKFEWQ